MFGYVDRYFFPLGEVPALNTAYVGQYDAGLVALSILIAILASYSALDISERMASTAGGARVRWAGAGAVSMGFGIWAMHFIGMLAFSLPCGISYDPWLTTLSILPGMLASALALYLIGGVGAVSLGTWLLGSVLMGGGIGAMHYSGMAALSLPALMSYDAGMVALSVVVAVALAMVALGIRCHSHLRDLFGSYSIPVAAVVMGTAIAGMHYTAMNAAVFFPLGPPADGATAGNPDLLAVLISLVAVFAISVALAAAFAGRQLETAQRLRAETDRRQQAETQDLKAAHELTVLREAAGRKQAEETLSAIIKAIDKSQMVAEFNLYGTIVAANENFLKAMGCDRDEVLGLSHSLFVAPDHAASDEYRAFWTALNRGEFQSGEFQRVGKGGKAVWIQAIYTPIKNSSGKVTKIIKYATDITERVATASALKDNQIRTRAIVETVVDGIVTIDAKGMVETFNPAAARIFGYKQAEVVGRNVRMLMPEPDRGAHDGYLANYLRTGQAKIIGIGRELVGQRKDGSTFPMELAVSEIAAAGKRMFIGIVRDITERKRADLMKREFVSTVSHELRTPLTSIKGSLGLIKSGVVGDLPEKMRRMLDIAYSNSDRLVRLINDILDIEKIEAGKMTFALAPLDLRGLVDQAIDANKGYAVDNGVNLVLAGELRDVRVNGDRDRLMQVMANLISNAAKFSPKGGTVAITLSRREGCLRVAVADRGPGIPLEFRDRIFGRFAQADSSDTRERGGSGLGLSIAKAIVERHAGTIGFETEIGQGTTFYFDIPELAEQAEAAGDAPATAGRQRILICEDDRDIATLLDLMLKQDGFATDIAGTAAEAERLLRAHAYAAMTLDLGLPDKNGIKLLKEIRQRPETRDLPIVVVSATAGSGRREANGDAITVIDWLEKPIDQARLSEGLRRALHGSPTGKIRVLHVEDDRDVAQVVKGVAGDLAEVTVAATIQAAGALLNQAMFDLVILDLMLPDGDGEQLLPLMKTTHNRATPVIVFSARELTESRIEQIKAALVKSYTSNDDLLAAIRAAVGGRRP